MCILSIYVIFLNIKICCSIKEVFRNFKEVIFYRLVVFLIIVWLSWKLKIKYCNN